MLLALTVGAVALVTGRGSGDDAATWRVQALGQGPSQDTGQPISDAICNDLGPNGLSGFQLKASTQETTAMSGEEFAEYLYGHLAVGCPALLQDESIRNFLTQWGVNPDA